MLDPELAPQRGQPARNQQELLRDMTEFAYLQAEADLLEAQSPGHIMQSFFGTPEEIRADIDKMTAVRTELAEIVSAPPQTPAVEVQYTPQTVSTMDAGNCITYTTVVRLYVKRLSGKYQARWRKEG